MSRVPLHEYEKAVKRKQFWDNVLTIITGLIILTAIGGICYVLFLAGAALYPHPYLFWPIVIGATLIIIICVGLTQYKKYEEIVKRGKKDGTIDE